MKKIVLVLLCAAAAWLVWPDDEAAEGLSSWGEACEAQSLAWCDGLCAAEGPAGAASDPDGCAEACAARYVGRCLDGRRAEDPISVADALLKLKLIEAIQSDWKR